MENKTITLGKYTFERAQIVKTILESAKIECFLENINLIQGAVSSNVKVTINETDLEKSLEILEDWLTPKIQKLDDLDITSDIKLSRILLPLDFSDYSRKTADIAFDWAVANGSELALFHAYFDPLLANFQFSDSLLYDSNLEELATDLKENGEKGLAKMKAYLMGKPNSNKVKISTYLIKGLVEDEIIRFCKSYQPELIIMGTRGKNHQSVDLIGSVTAEVIDRAKVPVLAIPEDFKYNGFSEFKNLLYLVNFEETDFKALNVLEKLLKPLGAKIICAHFEKDHNSHWDEVKMSGLSSFLKINYNDTDIVCDLIVTENFWSGIDDYVKSRNINAICLTSRRRNFISRLINPSIAKKMLFHSTTPLLVFH